MGRQRTARASEEPDSGRRVKLKFVALALGIETNELRARLEANPADEEMTLRLSRTEAGILRSRYDGEMPIVGGGITLLEDGRTSDEAGRRVPTASSGVSAHSAVNSQLGIAASSGVSDPVGNKPAQDVEPERPAEDASALPPADPVSVSPPSAATPFVDDHSAIRTLIRQLDNPDGLEEASRDLIRHGKAALPLLIQELPNPARCEKIRKILLDMGELAAPTLIWALSDPWQRPAAMEVLLEFSLSSPTQIANLCVAGLQNTDGIASARSILLEISRSSPVPVVNACCGALHNPRIQKYAIQILSSISEWHAGPVASRLVMALADERIRPVCTDLLVDFVRRSKAIDRLLGEWKDTDGFDRAVLIDYIRTVARSINLELGRTAMRGGTASLRRAARRTR